MYKLDTKAAKEANSNSRIDTTGAYIGKFTKAKKVVSQQGTQGIEFSFDSEEGRADFLTLWTVNGNGENIFGYKQLMSLMTCLKLRSIDSVNQTIDEWDNDAHSMRKVQAEVYPDLMNKEIGVVLQIEEYETKNGELRERPVIAGFYNAQSGMVAYEILEESTKAEALDKIIERMPAVKKLRKKQEPKPQHKAPNLANMDDDIPF